VLASVIPHGIWHLPFVLLAMGYHYDGNRVIVIPMFLVNLTIAGMFLASGEARTIRPSTTAAFVAVPLSIGQRASPPKPDLSEGLYPQKMSLRPGSRRWEAPGAYRPAARC
jgi:hypothetical protein